MFLFSNHEKKKQTEYAIAGGSDIALCCDIVIIDEDATIGFFLFWIDLYYFYSVKIPPISFLSRSFKKKKNRYPPSRVWGCPTPVKKKKTEPGGGRGAGWVDFALFFSYTSSRFF